MKMQTGVVKFSERGISFNCAVVLDNYGDVKSARYVIYFTDVAPKVSKEWYDLELTCGPLAHLEV